jgi:NTE family protein
VPKLEESGNRPIVTEHSIYDHRRLTTIYTDHDVPEHGATLQPPTLQTSPVETEHDTRTPEVAAIMTKRLHEFDGPLTAFVLSGGGSLGAIQVGMLRALLEAGIRPDLVVGTSIGALNAAYLVGHLDLDGIESMTRLWHSVQRRDVFRIDPRNLVRGALGNQNYLFSQLGLRSLITRAELGFSRLEDAPIPVHVVATDLFSGDPVVLSHGDTVDALLASAAIPGVFTPVSIDGQMLIDGGVVANFPVRQALELGAGKLFVLPAIFGGLVAAPASALDMMQHTTMIATAALARAELKQASAYAEVHVLPFPAYGPVSMFDFSDTATLIESAYVSSSSWMQNHDRMGVPQTI